MSVRLTSRGLPGVQTSSMACWARRVMSDSVIPSSDMCCGMPTFMASALTASTAAREASSRLMPAVSTPIARAISGYLSMHAGMLYSMMVGSRSALATPWGTSNNEPSGCAMPCTSPRPTLENAIPAMYCATAIPLRASALSGCSTAIGRWRLIMRMASISNMSDMLHAPFVIYPSMAWVSASMPVAAVSPLGRLYISSASIIATAGMSLGSTHTIFFCFASSMIT